MLEMDSGCWWSWLLNLWRFCDCHLYQGCLTIVQERLLIIKCLNNPVVWTLKDNIFIPSVPTPLYGFDPWTCKTVPCTLFGWPLIQKILFRNDPLSEKKYVFCSSTIMFKGELVPKLGKSRPWSTLRSKVKYSHLILILNSSPKNAMRFSKMILNLKMEELLFLEYPKV